MAPVKPSSQVEFSDRLIFDLPLISFQTFSDRSTNSSTYPMLSDFSKLCLAHRSCTFLASSEDPPFEKGNM